jgi:hypothetical protein
MRAGRIAGSAEGKIYTSRFGDFTGAITTPVLTLHTVTDGLVLPSQTTEYRRTLAAAGKSRDLRQVFVQSNGHCTFTAEEWLAALWAMGRRLDSGEWPSDKNLRKIFKFSPPQLRFVPFAPGPFPQPPAQ